MGRYMAGKESYWHWAKNVNINVKLSNKHVFPAKILTEISSPPSTIYRREYINNQYELEYAADKGFFCGTSDSIVISGVIESSQQYIVYDQYINFTLVYNDDSKIPLICPINGTPSFRLTLAWAEAID